MREASNVVQGAVVGGQKRRMEAGGVLFSSRAQSFCISYSSSMDSGSDAVASSMAGSCIHSWYTGTCSAR